MSRGIIKTCIAGALHYTGIDRLIGARARPDSMPLILGYHRVVDDFNASARHSIPAMLVSTRTLERHLDWLGRRYAFISLDDAAERFRSGRRGRPAAVLTFDDGYRDVYENAFPLLQRKGIPAAVFVVTGVTGAGEILLHDELFLLVRRSFQVWTSPGDELMAVLAAIDVDTEQQAAIAASARSPYDATRALLTRLSQPVLRALVTRLSERVRIPQSELDGLALMDWRMVSEMHRAGHAIGSHTRTHAYLTNEDPSAVVAELQESRAELARCAGIDTVHFAYPNGDFNAAIATAAEEAGYRYAYTTCNCNGVHAPQYAIPRRMVWERSGIGAGDRFSSAVFHCETRGVFDFVSGCGRERHA